MEKGGLEAFTDDVVAIIITLAFVRPWIAVALHVVIAAMWFTPDRRIESRLKA